MLQQTLRHTGSSCFIMQPSAASHQHRGCRNVTLLLCMVAIQLTNTENSHREDCSRGLRGSEKDSDLKVSDDIHTDTQCPHCHRATVITRVSGLERQHETEKYSWTQGNEETVFGQCNNSYLILCFVSSDCWSPPPEGITWRGVSDRSKGFTHSPAFQCSIQTVNMFWIHQCGAATRVLLLEKVALTWRLLLLMLCDPLLFRPDPGHIDTDLSQAHSHSCKHHSDHAD